MAGPQVVMVGARAFRKEMKAAGVELKDLKEPHAKAARTVADAARPRTPQDSGRLKDTVRSSGTISAGYIRAGTAKVPYANPIHWGWPARGIDPQPWLSKYAQATEPQWLPIFMDEVNAAVELMAGDYTRL